MGKVVRLANLTMAMQIPRHGWRRWEELTEEALLKCAVCQSFYWALFLSLTNTYVSVSVSANHYSVSLLVKIQK